MKITFYSNYLNHHQLPFCEALYKKYGDNFHFVACTPFNNLRKSLGYKDMNCEYPFVVREYEDEQQREKALYLAAESDIVIHSDGAAKHIYLKKRMQETKKVTFLFSERNMRKGRWHMVSPKARKNIYNKYGRYKNKPLYLLSAGAYAADDYILLGAFYKKAYKWGYFPETYNYDIDKLLESKEKNSILWVARFIDLKHPEKALKVAKKLKNDGMEFKLRMIGNGILEEKMKHLSAKYGLEKNIEFLGSMPPEKVREYMEKSEIFMFTSDRGEGWGAVLNEAMNSGCAVVADRHIGSVPYLIKKSVNGFHYNGSVNKLYKRIKHILVNQGERVKIGKSAYDTIVEEWNGEMAAERFVSLAQSLEQGKESSFESGPCSKA